MIDTATIKRIPAAIRPCPIHKEIEQDVLEFIDYYLSLPHVKDLPIDMQLYLVKEAEKIAKTYYSIL